MKTSVIRSASVVALALAALSASAQAGPTAAFSSSLFNVQRPAGAGSIAVGFPGTITSASPLTFVSFFNRAGTSALNLSDSLSLAAINAALASTGTYTGTIVTYTFRGPDSPFPTPLGQAAVTLAFGFQDGGSASSRLTVDVAPVPEPATMAALGVGALGVLRRRKRG